MSQSRFSIVLVGVSALLRRPLVSRLRPAGFTARGSGGFRRSGLPLRFGLPLGGWPSGSLLPLFGTHRFGVAAGRVRSFAFRFGDCRWVGWPSGSPLPLFGLRRFGNCPRRVGLRAHCFRFSACTVSEITLGGLAFGLTASAFRHVPIRRLPSAGWPSGSLLPFFGTHRFGDCPRRVGSSAFRFGDSARRVGLRTHRSRFSACSASEIALGGLVLPLGELAFGLTASAFRHAPLRGCRWAGWPSGSPLPLFGTHQSAPPHRRNEDRRSTPTRQLFHFKTLIPTC